MDDIIDEYNDDEDDRMTTKTAKEDLVTVEGSRPTSSSSSSTTTTYSSVDDRDGTILVCGAKGVGKSTFLRYATNRLLSRPTTRKVQHQYRRLQKEKENY